VLGILILSNQKQGVYIWACGCLSVPIATNVAIEEILLDTADLYKKDTYEKDSESD